MRLSRTALQAAAGCAFAFSIGCKAPTTPDYDAPDAAPPEDAPAVVSVSPKNGAKDVNRRPVVRVGFDRQLDATTVKNYTYSLYSGDSGRWLTSYYDPFRKELVVWPAGYLLRQSTWVFELNKGLAAADGIPVTPQVATSFRTGDDIVYETPYHVRYYEEDIAPIFESRCTSCHGGSEPVAGLKLDSKVGITETAISQPSTGRQNWDLIVPTQPGLSYLLYKLIDDGSTPGMAMPRQLDDNDSPTSLSDDEKEALVDWITMGVVFFDPEDTDQ
jgi:hypothetical protein